MADPIINEIVNNGNDNTSRPRKTWLKNQQLINEMGKMLSDGRSDREIMEKLQTLIYHKELAIGKTKSPV